MSSASADSCLSRLTPKEIACLRLVARRMSSKEIAAELGIAKTSVDTYCNRARIKLGVGGRQEAARLVRIALAADESAPAAHVGDAVGGDPGGDSVGGGAAARAANPALTNVAAASLAAALVVTLAVGALMAGFHALDAMKPPKFVSRVATFARPGSR